MKFLIIVPAKKNSTRLPNKNFLDFCGKPLYQWTLDEAERLFTSLLTTYKSDGSKIVLLTDAFEEVIRYSLKRYNYCQNTTIIKEPDWLAKDPYQLASACLFAIKEMEKYNETFDAFILVQPTNPLIIADDIQRCEEFFRLSGRPIRTFTDVDRLWKFDHDLNDVCNKTCNPLYTHAKQSCVGVCVQSIESLTSFKIDEAKLSDNVFPVFLPKERSVDINDEIDFEYAKMLMQMRINKEKEVDVLENQTNI